jgi:predicted ATPase/DNA-binding CsgD family transcriptional regulator
VSRAESVLGTERLAVAILEVPLLIEETQTETDMSGQVGAAEGNLPVQLTRLVGRDAALSELRSLVWRTRMLTLAGPGGAGKTRLAMALADAMRPDFIGGAWWVDLSTTLDPGLVPQVVAATVLQRELTSDPAPAALVRRFPESTLLALDNCEQVVHGCAELVVALLERSSSLRVIATSRQPLGVPGEQVWRVPGLAVTDPEPREDWRQPDEADGGAVALFLERAREASTSFDPDAPGVLEKVRRICEWLDGMPLAIELAAARVPVLSVGQIAERLERDQCVLRHTARTAPERHRTMDAMLEWSHRMLEPDEQRLFRRLSVFRGSFSLAAAELVCAGYQLDVADVLDLLATLIDRSLVQVLEHSEEPRYRLLATMRQYAAAKLWDGPEGPTVHSRHAEHFLSLAVAARSGLAGPEHYSWLKRLELEHDNLEAALQWLSEESIDDGARLARLLWPFWYQRGYYREARIRFERLLARAADISPARRGRVLLSAGEVAFLQCNYSLAGEYLTAALELVRELGDERATATVLQRLGSIAREEARYDDACDLHQRSLAIWQELGDDAGVAASHDYLGFVAWLSGDSQAAEEQCAAALTAFKRAGDLRATATTLVNLGACALYRDELPLARQRLEDALTIARKLGFQEAIAWALHELSMAERRARRARRELAPMLREALLVHHNLGDRWRVASVLEEIVGSLLVRHDARRGVEILAAVDTLREELGTPIPPAEAPDRDAAMSGLERRLGAGTFAVAWSEGRVRELDTVVDLAVEAIDMLDRSSAPDAPVVAPVLTPRELAVLELLADGQTNREIAAALYISPSTAGVHVSNILRKLGAKRRVDAAGIAHKMGLLPVR